MIAKKSESPEEKKAASIAATEFGRRYANSDDNEVIQLNSMLARLTVHEENAEHDIKWHAEGLMRQNPGLSHEDALIWAEGKAEHPADYRGGREVTLEEAKGLAKGRKTAKRLEMSSELSKNVEEARTKARLALLATPRIKNLLKDYERCLRQNDGVTAAFCFSEIDRLGLDVSDIEKNTPTKLDLEAIRSGNFPMLGLS